MSNILLYRQILYFIAKYCYLSSNIVIYPTIFKISKNSFGTAWKDIEVIHTIYNIQNIWYTFFVTFEVKPYSLLPTENYQNFFSYNHILISISKYIMVLTFLLPNMLILVHKKWTTINISFHAIIYCLIIRIETLYTCAVSYPYLMT